MKYCDGDRRSKAAPVHVLVANRDRPLRMGCCKTCGRRLTMLKSGLLRQHGLKEKK